MSDYVTYDREEAFPWSAPVEIDADELSRLRAAAAALHELVEARHAPIENDPNWVARFSAAWIAARVAENNHELPPCTPALRVPPIGDSMTTEIDAAIKAVATKATTQGDPESVLQLSKAVLALVDAKTRLFYASKGCLQTGGDSMPNLVGGPDPGNGPG